MTAVERIFHVTVLSNFARGFDKYSQSYGKERIGEYEHQLYHRRRNPAG